METLKKYPVVSRTEMKHIKGGGKVQVPFCETFGCELKPCPVKWCYCDDNLLCRPYIY